MRAQTDKIQESKNSITPRVSKEPSNRGTAQLVDNRASTIDQRKLQEWMNASMVTEANPIQRKEVVDRPVQSNLHKAQSKGIKGSRKANKTGLPNNLKSGIENLSGYGMDDVKVHYNSSKPAQLQAHAYAQGTNIHLAPGQQKHLPHEAWHVVQQKQGRVKPTKQLKSKVNINDDVGLEKEADVMGGKANQMKETTTINTVAYTKPNKNNIIQREFDKDYADTEVKRFPSGNPVVKPDKSNLKHDDELSTKDIRKLIHKHTPWKEMFWYHGTNKDDAKSIYKNGFDSLKTNLGKSHGPGVYFAATQFAARQYGDSVIRANISDYELLWVANIPKVGVYGLNPTTKKSKKYEMGTSGNIYKEIAADAHKQGLEGCFFSGVEWIIATIFDPKKIEIIDVERIKERDKNPDEN